MKAIVRTPGMTAAELVEQLLMPEPQARTMDGMTSRDHRMCGWNSGVRRAVGLLREIEDPTDVVSEGR